MNGIFEKFSLRTRLALLYSGLLVFSVALVGSYSYKNVWQLLIENKVSHIRARAKPVIEHWLKNRKTGSGNIGHFQLTRKNALFLAHDLTSRDTVAIILNRDGKIIANGRRLPEEPIPPAHDLKYVKKALSGENEITYKSMADDKPILVFLIPLRDKPASRNILGVIQMSTSLKDINRILFRHGAMLIAVEGMVLILGALAGFWLIGLSLNELRNLSNTCLKIAKGDFSQRVDSKNRKDETGRLARSFNKMIDQLQFSFAAQKRFVSNAAHELMTPLTGLRGSLEVLLRGAQDDPAAVARLSKGMYKEVNRLIRLCEQLLGWSRLENTSNLRKKKVVLSDFLSEFRQQAAMLAKNNPIIINEGPFVAVMADPDLLKQVLFDLLANSMRHTPDKSPFVLTWKLMKSAVEISFSDKGEGMDKETLSGIFEPFFRGKSSKSKDEKGIGLGLTLIKSIIEAHGGQVYVKSRPEKGTSVFFTLPLE